MFSSKGETASSDKGQEIVGMRVRVEVKIEAKHRKVIDNAFHQILAQRAQTNSVKRTEHEGRRNLG